VEIGDAPPLPDRLQLDALRQPFGPNRLHGGQVAPGGFDPAPMRVHEGRDLGGASATRYDKLERMRRQQAQRQTPRATAFAHVQGRRRNFSGFARTARVEESELLRHGAYRNAMR
jgi:hypothetical protein